MCSPCEEAQRLAEWQATGEIAALSNQVPFSCSAADSSADPFHLSQGTQQGTILEQAAAIITYSQVHQNPSPARQQHQEDRLLPQAVLHAAHLHMRAAVDASQTSSAAVPVPQVSGAQQGAAAAVAELDVQGGADSDRYGADAAACRAAAAAGQLHLPAVQVQATAVQGLSQLPSAPVSSQTGVAAPAQAETAAVSQSLKGARSSGRDPAKHATFPGTEADGSPKANPAELTARSEKENVQEVLEEAAEQTDDELPQAVEEDLDDIAPTEIQLSEHAPLADAAASHHSHPAPLDAFTTAIMVTRNFSGISHQLVQPQQQQKERDAAGKAAVCQSSAVAAEAAKDAPVPEALLESQQMLPSSPTQDLRLQLTYMEPASQQPQLHLAAEPLAKQAQQGQHAEQGPDVQDDPCQAAGESPVQLDLNLDTQVPDQPALVKAPMAHAPAGVQKSPEPDLRRGWWNQPWSIAQQTENANSLPAGVTNFVSIA